MLVIDDQNMSQKDERITSKIGPERGGSRAGLPARNDRHREQLEYLLRKLADQLGWFWTAGGLPWNLHALAPMYHLNDEPRCSQPVKK